MIMHKAILVKRNLNFCVDHFLNQLDADDHIQIKRKNRNDSVSLIC